MWIDFKLYIQDCRSEAPLVLLKFLCRAELGLWWCHSYWLILDLLFMFVLCHCKFNIFMFWTVGKMKQAICRCYLWNFCCSAHFSLPVLTRLYSLFLFSTCSASWHCKHCTKIGNIQQLYCIDWMVLQYHIHQPLVTGRMTHENNLRSHMRTF